MLYIHYCRQCDRIHILNGHKQTCPKCENNLQEMKISYLQYVDMSKEKRELYRERIKHQAKFTSR